MRTLFCPRRCCTKSMTSRSRMGSYRRSKSTWNSPQKNLQIPSPSPEGKASLKIHLPGKEKKWCSMWTTNVPPPPPTVTTPPRGNEPSHQEKDDSCVVAKVHILDPTSKKCVSKNHEDMSKNVEDIPWNRYQPDNIYSQRTWMCAAWLSQWIQTCHVSKSQMNGSSPNKSAKASQQAWNKKSPFHTFDTTEKHQIKLHTCKAPTSAAESSSLHRYPRLTATFSQSLDLWAALSLPVLMTTVSS